LTAKQYAVLVALVKRWPTTLKKEDLFKEVWPDESVSDERLHRHVCDLRQRLQEDGPGYIVNEPGVGYYLGVPVIRIEFADENKVGSANLTPEATKERELAPSEPLGEVGAPAPRETQRQDPELRNAEKRPKSWPRRWSVGLVYVFALSLLSCLTLWWATPRSGRHTVQRAEAAMTLPARVFGFSTSTHGSPPVSQVLGYDIGSLLITPDGKHLYVTERNGKSVTVLSTETLRVEARLSLPMAAGRSKMSHDGKRIYLASLGDGLMVLDTTTNRVTDFATPVGGPAQDIDVDGDENKAYLAMGARGLKVLDLRSRELKTISSEAAPQFLRLDPGGRRLFVSYQGGGPGGRPGHDAMVVYDLKSGYRPYRLPGQLPRVGGSIVFSPSLNRVMLAGWNACEDPAYDHAGCSQVPSQVHHLISADDLNLIATISLPVSMHSQCEFSPDGRQCLFAGSSALVYDLSRRRSLEKFSRPDEAYREVLYAPDGDQVFISLATKPEILMFRTGASACCETLPGLTNLYPGDGTLDDIVGLGSGRSDSDIAFAPGVIGQAFRFDSKNYVRIPYADACVGCGDDWAISLFMKIDDLSGESTILRRLPGDRGYGFRLYRSGSKRIVLALETDRRTTAITGPDIEKGRWYRIELAAAKGVVEMFLDGLPIGSRKIPPGTHSSSIWGDVYLGGSPGFQGIDGTVDELAFYARKLTRDEILRLHAPSAPPCRPRLPPR